MKKESTPITRSTIGDFSILPITLPPTRAYPHVALQHVYVRQNAPKIPTPDDDRSLFLANVPADSTEAHFRAVFTALVGAGKFESISFEDERRRNASSAASLRPAQALRLAQTAQGKKRKRGDEDEEEDVDAARALMDTWPRWLHRSGGTAVAVLADERCVALVLKAVGKAHKTRKFPVWGAGVEEEDTELGTDWLRGHNGMCFPRREAVQAAVDSFFTLFNRREREAAELAKRMRSEPDEDGFVTVVRGAGGRTAPARMDEAEEARRKLAEREERKRQDMGGFYRFQLREQKKAEQADLVRRFEEDRKKVSAMKEKRGKFRPEA